MTEPSRDQRAEDIFLQASPLDGAQQARFLAEACAGDPELLQAVTALLEAAADAETYFDDLASRLGAAALVGGSAPDDAAHYRGATLGQYRLTETLGSGGMGSVWRAERIDGRFEGEVAIKILHPGVSSPGAAGRLGMEARYLARLNHPHIARLLDAGVESAGRPYLVLEYVRGTTIDRYCDNARLDLRSRITLFLDVLIAVAHAHARLIVHRDIKPSNVLVTDDGQVKLLDFGIAKLLERGNDDGATGMTLELGIALTPEYAAPEQLLGQPVTTATDVYSLGLLLYVLLVGENPRTQGNAGPQHLPDTLEPLPPSELVADSRTRKPSVRLAAAERRATSPTTLRRLLRGDLDNILRRALAAQPEARYATATDLAADLRRYLNHEPVAAQPATFGYRLNKFARRHRGGVLTACITTFALIAATGITAWQMLEARQQRDLAYYQQQRLQASNEFYSLLLEEVGPKGEALTPVQLLDRGVAMLEQQYGVEDRFIGRVFYDVSRRYASLDETGIELELLAQAETIAREQQDLDLLATVLCARATRSMVGDPHQAGEMAAEAGQALSRIREPSLDARLTCLRVEARLTEGEGDRQGGIELLERALAEVQAAPTSSAHLHGLVLNDLGFMYFKDNRLAETLVLNDRALSLLEQSGRANTVSYLKLLGNRGAILGTGGEYLAEKEIWERVLARMEALNLQDRVPDGFIARYGVTLIRMSFFEQGHALLQEAHQRALAQGNEEVVAMSNLNLGKVLSAMKRFDEAEERLAAAEAVLRRNPQTYRIPLEGAEIARAIMDRHAGRLDSARTRIKQVLERVGYPANTRTQSLEGMLGVAAKIELMAGAFPAAERLATDQLGIAEAVARNPAFSANVGAALVLRAQARQALGHDDAAEADLIRAVESLTAGIGEDNPETQEARELLSALRSRV